MKRALLLTLTHLATAAAGFAAGIYVLPILVAPPAPSSAEVRAALDGARYSAEHIPGARLIAAGIAISTFGFCNISLIGAARVFQVMGADGVFFRVAGRLHPRWHTPNIALLMLAGWACVLALSGTFDQLLNYATVGDWLGYAAVVATLFWYRRQGEDAPFRTPWFPLLPLLFLAAVAWVVAMTVWLRPADAGMGALITLAGLPVYWIWRRLPARRAPP